MIYLWSASLLLQDNMYYANGVGLWESSSCAVAAPRDAADEKIVITSTHDYVATWFILSKFWVYYVTPPASPSAIWSKPQFFNHSRHQFFEHHWKFQIFRANIWYPDNTSCNLKLAVWKMKAGFIVRIDTLYLLGVPLCFSWSTIQDGARCFWRWTHFIMFYIAQLFFSNNN